MELDNSLDQGSPLPQEGQKTKPQRENMILNLAFNLVLPVYLLKKLTGYFGDNGPLIALIAALSLPVGYGLYDYYSKSERNWISLLGIFNILFTGGFALLGLTRNWYIVKETLLPSVIGFAVLISAYTKRPLVDLMLYNKNVLNIDLIENHLRDKNELSKLHSLLRTSTYLLSSSFFLSALLNFLLANNLFTKIHYFWNSVERASIRNLEIAEMTKLGYLIIALPCMVFMIFILWHLISGLKKITGMTLQELMAPHHNK